MSEPVREWDAAKATKEAVTHIIQRWRTGDETLHGVVRDEMYAALQAAYSAGQTKSYTEGYRAGSLDGHAAGADAERTRVFAMMRADIQTVTGLDWSPLEGRTLTWVFEQYERQELMRQAQANRDMHKPLRAPESAP